MSYKTDFDAKYNIIDASTPQNAFMSGHYKRSYAYFTLRNRLPVVLTNVIDTLTKNKNDIAAKYSEASREEIKMIIGLISQLKYELQTDKSFQLFQGNEPDAEAWNDFLANLPAETKTFYNGCWLHAECYMYRKLYSFFENSIFLKDYDYFAKVKEDALKLCIDDLVSLAKDTRRTEKNLQSFEEVLKINLWSNRNDFSLNEDNDFRQSIVDNLTTLDDAILVNNAPSIWRCLTLRGNAQKHIQVDVICDNAGFELFTDLILGEYLIEKRLATVVRFHVKAHPWFVSDITTKDFQWTLTYLSEHTDYILSLIGKKFLGFFEEGKFELAPVSHFWTGPHAFYLMQDVAPDLYNKLSQAKLIIFKGDLNFRKLMGDYCWKATYKLKDCLRGFLPTSLCVLRTVKAEVICGLDEGVYDRLSERDPNWMVNGNYGIISYVDSKGND